MTLDYFQYIILIIVLSLSTLLGIGVFLVNARSRTNQFYILTSIAISVWVLLGYLTYYDPLSSYALVFGRGNFAAVGFFFVAIYAFAKNFPIEKKFKPLEILFIFLGLILSILSLFTPWIIKAISISGSERIWEFGIFEYVYYLYGISAAIIVIQNLYKKYRQEDVKERAKIRILTIGVSFVALFNIIFNIVLPMIFPQLNIYWIGDYSLIFFLAFTAYAIVKYQLFNIKLVATEIIVIYLSIGLLVDTFISRSSAEGLLKALIWVLATYGGWQLIKSVKKEIKQREELQKLTKQLESANEHLKEMDKLKDDFLSMASHELNTPITAIKGYLSMILEEHLAGEVNPTAKQYLGRVYESAKRLSNLVKDLLNVSRIESGRIHIIYEETPVEDLIEQAQAEVMPNAKNAGHKMVFDKPKSKIPRTWLDKTRITEVLINIMGNAIKYTDAPGLIESSVTADDKMITVVIKDNGRGIPKDKQDSVFTKFSQVDVLKDQVKGTGLGMYISKKFIELMGGKIWFESGEGKGTTFFFTIPILDKKPVDPHEGEGEVLH